MELPKKHLVLPPEQVSPQEEAFYSDIFEMFGSSIRMIEHDRRLLPVIEGELMEEFVVEDEGTRFLALSQTNPDARRHVELMEAKLPVFSAIYTAGGGTMLLQIPQGTKLVRKMLPAILRNPTEYGQIFQEVGHVLRQTRESGLGSLAITGKRSALSQLAFAFEQNVPNGGRVYLVPPYTLEPEYTGEAVTVAIYNELRAFGYTYQDQVQDLGERVLRGLHHDG